MIVDKIKAFVSQTATTCGPPTDHALPCLTMNDVSIAEDELGIKLPRFLVTLYTEVGNGGFGPGFGFLPLLSTPTVNHGRFVTETCLEMRATKGWNDTIVPIVTWGCGVLSCLDTASDELLVYRFEPNMPDQMTIDYLDGYPYMGAGLIPEKMGFSDWLEEWLVGNSDHLFRRMNVI